MIYLSKYLYNDKIYFSILLLSGHLNSATINWIEKKQQQKIKITINTRIDMIQNYEIIYLFYCLMLHKILLHINFFFWIFRERKILAIFFIFIELKNQKFIERNMKEENRKIRKAHKKCNKNYWDDRFYYVFVKQLYESNYLSIISGS